MGESCNWIILPTLYPIIGGLAAYCVGRKNRKWRNSVAQFVTFTHFAGTAALFFLSPSFCSLQDFCGMGLTFQTGNVRLILLLVFSFAWMMTTFFSEEYFTHDRNRNRYYFFNLITLGAVSGIILSADWFTFLLFFEIMSFSSYVWVVQEETKEALRAGETYLAISVIGGLSILMGLFLIYSQTGTLVYAELGNCSDIKYGMEAAVCILVGAGAKAGAFPLHIWLPKAHPAAPAPASALLSGVLTKTGVFGIIIMLYQMGFINTVLDTVMLLVGVITMLLGAVLALASVNLKRILACSSISQIGFILTGLSLGNRSGFEGAYYHMVNHALLKLVLFLTAGVVFMNLHKLNLDEIQGFGRKKPLLHFAFLAGAAGIAGIPFGNAYFSKTLIHEGIIERMTELRQTGTLFFGQDAVLLADIEKMFLLAGGFTAAYMAKIYICLFIQKNKDAKLQESYNQKIKYRKPKGSFVLTFSASLLLVLGIAAAYWRSELYFSAESLKGIAVSLFIGIVLYILFVGLPYAACKGYRNLLPKSVDLEERIYRPLLVYALPILCATVCRLLDRSLDYIIVALRKTIYRDSPQPHELPEGNAFTHILGKLLDDGTEAVNKTIRKKKPLAAVWEHRLATLNEMFSENNMIIARSLSFGLILAAIGLLMTLIYLLF